jgi:hypothetical protein
VIKLGEVVMILDLHRQGLTVTLRLADACERDSEGCLPWS